MLEYGTVTVELDWMISRECNEQAKDGWRLVQVVEEAIRPRTNGTHAVPRKILIFEREEPKKSPMTSDVPEPDV